MISSMEQQVRALTSRLRGARRVTVMTGAGVSAASGVPTFRGAEGLWRTFRPEDLATVDAFARDPALVWEWYSWRRAKVASCRPNAAHEVIARWSHDPAREVRVITQNVDDLHLRAGTRELIRLHGSLWETKCFNGCAAGAHAWRDEELAERDRLPRCPHCGGLARPAVVWFGESLDAGGVERAAQAAFCDLFLTVGTSAVVYPAAGFVRVAQARGAFTAEINLEPTPASALVDLSIRGAAEAVLPAVDQFLATG
jgi:NAD-dependent protein deacetylase/lipoamidase